MAEEKKRFIHDSILKLELTEEEMWKLEQKRRKKLRNEITHKLRFKILERDKFTCYYCGKGRKAYPDIVLEIDHLKPLDSGGDNEESNLVTACWECNEGKKNTILANFVEKGSYNLHIEEIIKAAESGDHDKFKLFLTNPSHLDDRQFLYDVLEKLGRNCPKDCMSCSNTGTWFFVGCMQMLYRHVKKIDKKDLIPAEINPPRLERTPDAKLSTSLLNRLQCDSCYISVRCPEYQVGQSCAFDIKKDIVSSDNAEGVMKVLVEIQQERVMRGQFFEKIDGGAIDKNVSQEIGLLARLVSVKSDIGQPRARIEIKGEAVGKEGTSVLGGIMAGIFNSSAPKEVAPETDEAEIISEDNDKG